MQTIPQAVQGSIDFILNEVKEYTELTGEKEFHIYGRDEVQSLEVRDGKVILRYESQVLWSGTLDGKEGALDPDNLRDVQADSKQSPEYVEVATHGSYRRLAMQIVNRNKAYYNERMILDFDPVTRVTTIRGKPVHVDVSQTDFQVTVSVALVTVGGKAYTFTPVGDSFEIAETTGGMEPVAVEQLILPYDHAAQNYICFVNPKDAEEPDDDRDDPEEE